MEDERKAKVFLSRCLYDLRWKDYFQKNEHLFIKIGLDLGLGFEEAQYAMMDGVLAFLEKKDGNVANPTQFIIGVIKHKASDRFRSLKHEEADSELIDIAPSRDIPLTETVSIKQFLDVSEKRMPAEEYFILFDKYGNDLTLKQIGERRHLTIDQVFYRLASALAKAKAIVRDSSSAE